MPAGPGNYDGRSCRSKAAAAVPFIDRAVRFGYNRETGFLKADGDGGESRREILMEHADVVVIGAGVLGCFAARALTERALSVLVLEAANSSHTLV